MDPARKGGTIAPNGTLAVLEPPFHIDCLSHFRMLPNTRTKRFVRGLVRFAIFVTLLIAALGLGWRALFPEIVHVANTSIAQLTIGDLFWLVFIELLILVLLLFAYLH